MLLPRANQGYVRKKSLDIAALRPARKRFTAVLSLRSVKHSINIDIKSPAESAVEKKRWRLVHLPITLVHGNLNNAHKNVQECSKTFKPSVHNVDSTWTNTAKT